MKKSVKSKNNKILEVIKSYEHKELVIFVLIIFIIYLSTLSCSLDDEDSVHFIRGVREFNVVDYQPHPPGYPVYIFLGKISVFFMQDELLGLTTMSAVFGALALVVFYFLIFEMFDKRTALMSSMILAVTPLFWLNSLKAMTDIPGLFFILLSMYFIYYFIKYKKIRSLYAGALISGIAMGVRFHSFFVVVPLLIYACLKIRRKVSKKKKIKKIKNKSRNKGLWKRLSKNQKKILWCLVFFLIGILIWLVPTLIINGFVGYFKACLGQFLIRFENPKTSTLAGDFNLDYLFSRIKYFIGFFLAEGYGVNLWNPEILQVVSLGIYLFLFLFCYKSIKDKKITFFVMGLVFYTVMVLLFLTPHNPRYFLPLIPFVSLLFSLGFYWFGNYKNFAFAFLFVFLLIHAVPLALIIHTTDSAPVQLVNYINSNYNLEEVILLRDYMTFRHLSYYNITSYPEHSLKWGMPDSSIFIEEIEFREESNKSLLRSGLRDKLSEFRGKTLKNNSLNDKGLKVSVFDKNKTILIINPSEDVLQNYRMTLIKVFQRDLRIHPKHHEVYLYEIERKID